MSADETLPTTTRRWLLRGAGVAAAGAAVAVAAGAAPAAAADGDPVLIGAENDSSSETAIRIGGAAGSADPALSLHNAAGPTLALQPIGYESAPEMRLGELANTELGPVIGVDSVLGLTTTFLATGIDLDDIPTPYALPTPKRVLDTRTAAGRASVLRTSTGAYDSAFRLRPGAWIDVEVAVEDAYYAVPSAWLTAIAVAPLARGAVAVYPPGDFPGITTVSFPANQNTASGTFVGTGIVSGRFAVRVRATATTHVVLDLTGVTIKGLFATPAAQAGASADAKAKVKASARDRRTAGRLRSALAERLTRSLAR